MKLIGIKRLLILGILLGINLVLAGLYLLWVDPMVTSANQELAAINGEISTLHGQISSVKNDLAEFKKNLPRYEQLKVSGFMSGQDRFEASRDLDKIRKESGLSSFSFNINDITQIKNDQAKSADMKVIESRIEINKMVFLLDNNFYRFLDIMANEFPQQLRLENFSISRTAALDQSALVKIQQGQIPSILNAQATFDWISIVPLTDDDKKAGGINR